MDEFNNLTDAIREDTASSAVSYIPDGFTSTKQMIRSLGANKSKWGIEILEDEGAYDVRFESVLTVHIPKPYFDHFNEKVLNVKGLEEVDLSGILNEATVEDSQTVAEELVQQLTTGLRDVFVVENSIYLVNSWQRVFGGNVVKTSNKPLISIESYDRDVQAVSRKIQQIYSDDVGSMEMVITAISERKPLTGLDFFSDYEFLLGSRVQSRYQGINLSFDCAVNLAWQPQQSIWCDDERVLEELDYYRKYVKITGKLIVPVHGHFVPSVFTSLVDIIDGLED